MNRQRNMTEQPLVQSLPQMKAEQSTQLLEPRRSRNAIDLLQTPSRNGVPVHMWGSLIKRALNTEGNIDGGAAIQSINSPSPQCPIKIEIIDEPCENDQQEEQFITLESVNSPFHAQSSTNLLDNHLGQQQSTVFANSQQQRHPSGSSSQINFPTFVSEESYLASTNQQGQHQPLGNLLQRFPNNQFTTASVPKVGILSTSQSPTLQFSRQTQRSSRMQIPVSHPYRTLSYLSHPSAGVSTYSINNNQPSGAFANNYNILNYPPPAVQNYNSLQYHLTPNSQLQLPGVTILRIDDMNNIQNLIDGQNIIDTRQYPNVCNNIPPLKSDTFVTMGNSPQQQQQTFCQNAGPQANLYQLECNRTQPPLILNQTNYPQIQNISPSVSGSTVYPSYILPPNPFLNNAPTNPSFIQVSSEPPPQPQQQQQQPSDAQYYASINAHLNSIYHQQQLARRSSNDFKNSQQPMQQQPIQPPSSPHTYIPSQSPTEQFHNFSAHQNLQQQQQQPQTQQQTVGGAQQQQQQQVFITPLYLQGSDGGYVASPQAGFSAPQSGPPHQGPPAVLRGMQSTPPTPPQQDLNKMQQPTQSMFVPQGTTNSSGNVRPSQQTNLFRGATSNSAQRAPRHNIATLPPAMYPPQIQQVVMPYTSFAPRQPTSQIYSSTHFSHYPQQQLAANFASYPPFYFPTNSILSTQHRPSVPSGIVQQPSGPTLGPTGSQGQMAMSTVLTQPTGVVTSAGTGNTAVKRKAARPHAIPIIHPESHKNVLEEMELSKAQSANNTELEYQDHVNMATGDLMSSGTPQPQDLGMTADSNCNNKTMQGMAYVDVMQHHKMGAMSPCQSGYNQVNEMIGPTPIVSAMTDAPSVEIHPKQQTKKKNKSIEIVAPPPPTPPSTEKVIDNKNQTSVHPESIREEIAEVADSSETTTSCSFSPAPKVEEDTDINKAIQSKGEIKSTHNSAELISADTNDLTNIAEQSPDKNIQDSSPIKISSSNQQKQQSQTCSQQSQTTPTSIQSSSSSVPLSSSSSSPTNSTNTKRDTKVTPSSASHSLPPLPPNSSLSISSTNSSNQTIATTTTNAAPINSTNNSSNTALGKPDKSASQSSSTSTASGLSPSTAKQAAASITSNPNVTTSSTGKQSKGKDKQHQQQQASGLTAAAAAAAANNNSSTSTQVDATSCLESSNNKIQSKHNSVNNNIHQPKQPEKMKLEKEDKQHQKLGINASEKSLSNVDKKDSANNLNSSSSSNKKISDKNENIIPCKNYAPEVSNNSAADSNSATNVGTDVGRIENTSSPAMVPAVSSQQSHDETDKAASPTTMPDDNVNYYKKSNSNNNNNNEKYANVDNKSNSSHSVKPKSTSASDDAKVQKSSRSASKDNSSSTTTRDSQQTPPKGGDVNSNQQSTDSAGIANGHATVPSIKPESKSTIPASQPLIKYNDGQWSPSNTEGVKVYDRLQLLTLRDAPLSKSIPDVSSKVPSYLFQTTRSPQPSLMPPFMLNNSNKRGGQSMGSRNLSIGGSMSGSANSGSYHKQSSMSGVNAKNSSKGSKTGMIHVSLSLREDVKLNETENAWRPTHLKHDDTKSPEMIETEDLYRRVRGILNKLTPEKFETLVDQIMRLQIDTPEKIKGVMELVFEKAVDEPNFSVSYARLCQRLGDIKILTEESKDQKLNFKGALIDKTENEFSHNVLNRQAKEKLQPIMDKIKECNDPEKKQELQASYEDEERKIRRRSGGTVRFIGELFKISMLTGNIINSCIESLLDPNNEDKLECLCKLLETVGSKFEKTLNQKDQNQKNRMYNLDSVIKKMQAIADRKVDSKISSRVRFMLQDVIDLRKNKWASSRIDLNPKTMEQIQKEAKTEQISSQYMNYNMMPNKKEDRRYGGGGGGGGGGSSGGSGSGNSNMSFGGGGSGGGGGYFNKGNRQQQNDDTWYTQTGKGSRAVDTSKLGSMLSNSANIDSETKLGTSSQFIWSNYGRQQTSTPTATTTNSFAVLSSLDSNKNSNSGPRNKGSYNKGSMERDRYDVVHSRTGSAHGSRESSSSRNPTSRSSSNMQKSTSYQNYNSNSSATPRTAKTATSNTSQTTPSSTLPSPSVQIPAAPPPAVFDDLESEQNQAIMSALNEMVEIVMDSKIDECIPVIKKIPEGARWGFLYNIFCDYLHLGKTKPMHRRFLAKIILFMLSNNFISIEHFKKGYQEFCELAADTVIDVPDAWNYVLQFMVPLIHKKVITIKDIWNDTLKETRQGEKFLKNLILQCTREIGPNFMITLWESSGLKWIDFIDEDDVDRFIKDNQFEFIESKEAKPPLPSNPDVHKIMDRVKELLNDSATIDAIIDYISGNTVDIDKAFIRGLTTTLCNYAIQNRNNYVLDQKRFQNICIHLLQRYIDSQEDRELECLYAIQVLVNSLEHPSGLLSELFGELYDAYVIPQESFVKWRDSKEEPAGKGVAVKGLNPFFNNILSGETSDENN